MTPRLKVGAALAALTTSPAFAQEMTMPMPADAYAGHTMAMQGMMHDGAPAAFSMGSGTSREPGEAPMYGLHLTSGDWTAMVHGYALGMYTNQGGPRGSNEAVVQSMAMVEASRPLGSGAQLALRGMASLDPLMGNRGYPLLFATGETAGGRPLVDRQHPHDLFMELSARVDIDVVAGTSLFVYGGLPGEPALGPSAFMHRGSARLNPEAPITHHWFDSTHISFGVLTAGIAAPRWQLEASLFNAREPDENRWDIETAPLKSWSVRASWAPSPDWAAQLSYGRLKSPERLHPGEDEGRLIASIAYAAHGVAASAGWSRKDRMPGQVLSGWFAEGSWDITDRHTLFGRAERVRNDELFEADPTFRLHEVAFTVTKLSLGYAYSVPLGNAAALALGGTGAIYGKADRLDAAYGTRPKSFTLFARLSLGR